ncbi:MaoC family dehydratase [Natrinema caseinilyticum]|uniref:MaoC family dehydratase n=1 Tax=Natrinema caseinilyticum TaxID=2961570 RepID=UPI0020C5077D|nr:MaoC family dehydratase [Natrinema caseinilyticum]
MSRYFEDLDPGDVFETRSYTIEKDEIVEFAEEFDPQPFHVDEAAAGESIFGELIASGHHTMCIASKLTVEDVFDEIANLGGRGMDDLRFRRPVQPGDTLRVELEVIEKSASDRHADRGDVTFEQRVYNDDAEVLSVRMQCIVRRDLAT